MEDLAKQIREAIKTKLGYNSRKVSVRNRPGGFSTCVNITVKDLNIPLEPFKEIAKEFKEIERCERSGDILSGGTYVFVEYDWQLKYA